jgi:ATP-dependent DNA helicase RecQ
MNIIFDITPQDTVSGALKVSVSESRVELAGFASGRKVTVEGIFGDISVKVAQAEEALQPAPEHIEPVVEAVAQVQSEAVEQLDSLDEVPEVVEEDSSVLLFQQLVALRKQIAKEAKLPPYIIFHDATLKEMCRLMPLDLQALKSIQGVGAAKLEKYGSRFLEVIHGFTSITDGVA